MFDEPGMDQDDELVRACLTLISRIAAQGASSPEPRAVHNAMLGLRIAFDDRFAGYIGTRSQRMLESLKISQSMSVGTGAAAILSAAARSTWN
jgi:hypothetical protein